MFRGCSRTLKTPNSPPLPVSWGVVQVSLSVVTVGWGVVLVSLSVVTVGWDVCSAGEFECSAGPVSFGVVPLCLGAVPVSLECSDEGWGEVLVSWDVVPVSSSVVSMI